MLGFLRSLGLTPDMFYAASIVSMVGSVLLWFVPRRGDESDKGRPERLAIFVGLWPPTLFLMGHALHEDDKPLDKDEEYGSPPIERAMKQGKATRQLES